ncbi:DNRLRE domain-containing protein [Streptomyces sp. NBC_00237]|uniref:DNRLRE domain-containing protein n=1 Tax=Streptomyces sp. NBC_00237 TaxID=2975687 RepID=UPI0022572C37|nr:DNRLRE domain-containing protein [Streptomyces sp. NBC_00237]MCX5202941.1 DNRLRE domain-containing protein [Streptomyces sp. NBC_00237]
MRTRHRRFIAALVVSAVLGTALPQIAYAAPAPGGGDDGDGKSFADTVSGWFGGDDEDPEDQKPPPGGKLEIPSRERLPKGENAPKAKRVKELTGERTSSARFWQLSDGRVEAELSAFPTSYRQGSAWKPIDTSVRASGKELSNTTNTAASYFGRTAKELLRYEVGGGRSVTLGLDGPSGDLAPSVKGDTVTYKDPKSGADLVYQVGAGQVKENIVLAQKPGTPLSFSFRLSTDGLTPKARKDGSIAFFGETSKHPVLVIPAPFMTDSKKSETSAYGQVSTDKVTQKLARDGQGWKLTVTPDAKWLADPARQYPVTVDPTLTVAPLPGQSQDTMVLSDTPEENFGTSWKMSVGKTGAGVARSLLKFPLDQIPAGTKIDAARLGLYFDQVHASNANDVPLAAHRATGAWDESTATWTNTNALVGEVSGTSVQAGPDVPASTAAVGEWPKAQGTGGDFAYNQNAAKGETYSWQPTVPESGKYRVEARFPGTDLENAATEAPYTVTGSKGSTKTVVDQSEAKAGNWSPLGDPVDFARGTAGKIVLGDSGDEDERTLAGSVRLVADAQVVKTKGQHSTWHRFPVKDTVQKWVDGTAANHGFVVKAVDESATGPLGGPRYESADGNYDGETANFPRLTVTFGAIGTELSEPTVVHGSGPELSWAAYTNTTGDVANDLVEYQVHRSATPGFTVGPDTLVAPVAKDATLYTDVSATPTPPASANEIGRTHYYQIAVKTKGGKLLGSPVRDVGVPKAGRTLRILPAAADTTLSSSKPDVNLDKLPADGALPSAVQQAWLSVGNNSTTHGTTRSAFQFPTTSIPDTATVLQSQVQLWGAETTTGTKGATYDLAPLSKDFAETAATWNKANATTRWTKPGGDFGPVVSDSVGGITSEVGRHTWDATSLTQKWVEKATPNTGVVIKLANEAATAPQERTMFLSGEAAEERLRPQLRVIYIDSTPWNTYYAPHTPQRMTEDNTYPVDVTLTNTSDTAWAAGERKLSYRWALPDGSELADSPALNLRTDIPALLPGEKAVVKATVKSPLVEGNRREGHTLIWDVFNPTTSTWLSKTDSIGGLEQPVAVEDPTADRLGMEKYHSYTGKNTGAGSTFMSNLGSGNGVWSYNAFNNPGRGLNTFLRLSYNAQDTADTQLGNGWSAQASGPMRLGTMLDFHPDSAPGEVYITDGDGTQHIFRKQGDGTWRSSAGYHYLLKPKAGVTCTDGMDEVTDAWTMTRPDGTRFQIDCDGYLRQVIDKNNNVQTYVYEVRDSGNRWIKFLKEIKDPAGRSSLKLDYYLPGDATYEYIEANGEIAKASVLWDPKIYDHVKSMTDISGRKITFHYTRQGTLGRLTDGDGTTHPKIFKFGYDTAQGAKNVKLTTVTDPRNNATTVAYDRDPGYRWSTTKLTDRLGGATTFAYTPTGSGRTTKVTDAQNHTSTYVTDGQDRATTVTNAKSQTTKMTWDDDHNVTLIEENNGAKTAYCYDPKTGFPIWQRSAEDNKAGIPTAAECAGPDVFPAHSVRYQYKTQVDGYAADLVKKTSAEGRAWQFGYDGFGNLNKVTDPKGVETAGVEDDFTTKYEYDGFGQLTRATDANGNATLTSDFTPTGYPRKTTNAENHVTTTEYDVRGQVTSVIDALGKKTTQTYDTYGRPLVSTIPKEANVVLTTFPPDYDANDNVFKSKAINGAISTAVYDKADQIVSATAPQDTATSAKRESTYTYDKVGNLTSTTEPKGTATTANAKDYVTTNTYDEIYQLTDVTNAAGDKVSYLYDGVGNPVRVIDPKKNKTPADDYTTKTDYDFNHRVIATTDAAGKTSRQEYDKDSLPVAAIDAEGNKVIRDFDKRGKLEVIRTPHATDVTRETKFGYDQVGNRIKTFSPRGVATTDNADDFTSETVYDKLNRPWRQIQPYDPKDARYNKKVFTETTYDSVGRVAKVSMPPSSGETTRNDTTYTYYDTGWVKSAKDPWDILTEYDYDNLGQQTKRTLTSAGGSSQRTMTWEHFPDGKLKSLQDGGIPVGTSVVLVNNTDKQNVSATGAPEWKSTLGRDHVHAPGMGTDAFQWTLNIPKDGRYAAYVKYPKVAGASPSATYSLSHAKGSTNVKVDQRTNTDGWVKIGDYDFKEGTEAHLKLAESGAGTVAADSVKLVRDNSAEADVEKKRFDYAYDVNGNLTSVDDTSSGRRIDAYTVTYTGLNQVETVTEALAGQEKKKTAYAYDENGQPKTQTHPDQFSSYTYDLRELVKTVTVGKSSSDPAAKVSTYDYTDRGQKKQEIKGNKNVVGYTYYLDGALKTQTEKKPDGTLISDHAYAYDANGNKAEDVAQKRNADDATKLLSSTTKYTYEPADRLATATKTGNGAGVETYIHDDNANVISQTVKGKTTTFGYDRNRLLKTTVGGAVADHIYDPFGRQDSVKSGTQVIEKNTYDGFDHVIKHDKADATGALKSTTYAFDPLDRTTSKTEDGKKTEYNYLGMSGEVLTEEVATKLTASYQYSPWGERLSQVKHAADGTTTDESYYGYNSHTDVETLTGADGNAKATYGYTAYGSDDTSDFTGIDKPSATNPTKDAYNPYRFNSKRWDAASGTYDMGFRNYSPGLNRFTSRDMYNGALADMGLSTDPMTGNRYAFTGGNPTSRVELDGHDWCDVCSDALDAAGEWIDHNADALGEALVGTVETVGGVAGMFGGAALVVSSAGLCVAGAVPSIGTSCVAGAAGVAAGAGAVVAGAGLAVDGAMRLGNGIAKMENPSGGGSSSSQGGTPPKVTAGGAPADVALGYQKAGTANWANKKKFTHYMDPKYIDDWSIHVRKAIDDPDTVIHVQTEQFTGGFQGMATRGLAGGKVDATEQEMAWLSRAVIAGRKSWNKIQFYDRNGPVKVVEPKWQEGKWSTAWTLEFAD